MKNENYFTIKSNILVNLLFNYNIIFDKFFEIC